MNIFYLKKCACPTSKKLDFADKIGNLGGQEPGTKKQFEYLLFEKMRLPTLKKLDFADNIVKFMEIYWKNALSQPGNLGGQESGTKKQFENLLFETRCSPRTRMLTRMLMVQMSKHMDMQSHTTLFCNSLFEQSCSYFPCYQSAVWSGKCRVWSVKCGVWSVA